MREPRSDEEAGPVAALNNWTIPQEYLGVIVRVVPVLALLVAVVLVWPGDDGADTVSAVRTEATKPAPATNDTAAAPTDIGDRTTSSGQSPRPLVAPDADLAAPPTAANTTDAATAVTATAPAAPTRAEPNPGATTSSTAASTARNTGSGLSTAAANTTTSTPASTSASTGATDTAQRTTTTAKSGATTSAGRATSVTTGAGRTSTTAKVTTRPTTATSRATTSSTGATTTRATTSTTGSTTATSQGTTSSTEATTTTTEATTTTAATGGGGCSSGGQFERVFRDDFSGSSLGGEWIKFDNQPGNSGFGRREASALSVENGRLVITARMVDGNLESSGISLPRYQTYGKYIFRIRTDNDPSQAMSGVALTWPQSGSNHNDGENNIYETLANSADRNPFYSFIHKPGSPATEQKRFVHNADGAQFQTMTMEWTPDKISIRREGPGGATETQTLDEDGANRIPDNPHRIGFQLDAWKDSISATVKMEVDWVEIHKYCG